MFKTYIKLTLIIFFSMVIMMASAQPKRIITLGSAITETVFALDKGNNIVAVDVTSVSPAAVKSLPKVSRNRAVSAESLVAFHPDLVLVPDNELTQETRAQLQTLGIKVVTLRQEYSAKGSLAFIRQIAAAIGAQAKGEQLAQKTNTALQEAGRQVAAVKSKSPKVLFIYARGTGVMNVAGKGSSIDAIIKLAGGRNAITEFSDFKPYTTEALVKANPDVILMFDFGLNSLGGTDAVMDMPGMKLTTAGKNRKIVTIDGPLLINFSSRLPEAILELNKRIN